MTSMDGNPENFVNNPQEWVALQLSSVWIDNTKGFAQMESCFNYLCNDTFCEIHETFVIVCLN